MFFYSKLSGRGDRPPPPLIFIQYIDYTYKYVYKLHMYKKPLILMQYTVLRSILFSYVEPEDVYQGS